MNFQLRNLNVTTPVTDFWDWRQVNVRRGRLGVVTYIRLLLRPWLTVTAPKGTACAVTNLYGYPLYRYKELNGSSYFLQPEPGVGFPGS